MLKEADIKQEYLNRIMNNPPKIEIGNGNFGKIKISVALTTNTTSDILKVGQIICVKKTKDNSQKEKIRKNTWNNYLTGDISKLINSPDIYDMKIIEIPNFEKKWINGSIFQKKGYTFQKFLPVSDGDKAFGPNGIYSNNISHQICYLISIFEIISVLLNKGIYFSDFKPANTLYNPEEKVVYLIDLSSIIHKKNKEALRKCTKNEIDEFNHLLLPPKLIKILNEIGHENETFDLIEIMPKILGNLIKYVCKNSEINEPLLKDLSKKLQKGEYPIEEALKIMKEKNQIEEKDTINLMNRMKECINDKKEIEIKKIYGFNLDCSIFNLDCSRMLKENYIELQCSNISLDLFHENLKFDNLEKYLDDFIKEKEERVLVLLGSAGSGKTTILQVKFLQTIKNWKTGDPIPIYINLASIDDIEKRWKNICQNINNHEINFSYFPGYQKYPVFLFIDSFDEVAGKINFVKKFFQDLGNNDNNRCIICCRSEFIKKSQEIQELKKWFQPKHDNIFYERNDKSNCFDYTYIAPLNVKSFKEKIKTYYEMNYHSENINIEKIMQLIEKQKLNEIMKNCYKFNLVLETLPKLVTIENITSIKLFEEYSKNKIIENVLDRKSFEEKFNLKVNDNNGFIEFNEKIASRIARILNEADTTKISFFQISDEIKEIDKVYQNNNNIFENKILQGILKGLELNVEINELITIGFIHDIKKNYYLSKLIIHETENIQIINNKCQKELSKQILINDEVMMNFLLDAAIENEDFRKGLRIIIDQSKKADNNDKSIIAASNAIFILVAANYSFAGENLSKIKIPYANLRDGCFNGCDLSEADLSDVILQNCKLSKAIIYKTNLKDIKIGIHPDINANEKNKKIVYCCCFSPNDNGKYILYGAGDKSFKLWNRETCQEVKIEKEASNGHINIVSSVVFSSKGKWILTGSHDKTIKLWCFENEKIDLYKTFKGHEDFVNSIVFLPNNENILSGSADGSIRLWNIENEKDVTGKILIESSTNPIKCLSFCSDMILACSYKEIFLWDSILDMKNPNKQKNKKESAFVKTVVFSPNGTYVAAGLKNWLIKLYDLKLKEIKTFEGHKGWINSIVFSPNGKILLSGSSDKTIKLFDSVTGQVIEMIERSFEEHTGPVNSVGFSQDGTLIISASVDGFIKIRDGYKEKLLKKFENGHIKTVNSAVLSPNGNEILSCSDDKTIKLWNSSTGKLLKELDININDYKTIKSAIFSISGNYILAIFDNLENSSIKMFDSMNYVLKKSFEGHTNSINSIAFSSLISTGFIEEEFFCSGSDDKTIKLWEIHSGKCIRTFFHTHHVKSVAFSPNGIDFVFGSECKFIKIWNISTNDSIDPFPDTSWINCVCFSPDGNSILSGSGDEIVKLFNIESKNQTNFVGHKRQVYSVAFSHSGKYIVSGSEDKTIKLWSTDSKALIQTLEEHSDFITSVIFSHDDSSIISSSKDKSIKIWIQITENDKHKNISSSQEKSNDNIEYLQEDNNLIKSSYFKETINPNSVYKHNEEIHKLDEKENLTLKANYEDTVSSEFTNNSNLKLVMNPEKNHQDQPYFEPNYLCKFTIYSDETPLFCKDLTIKNPLNFNSSIEQIFLINGAKKLE